MKVAYEAIDEDEISVQVGDVVDVIDKVTEDEGWWKVNVYTIEVPSQPGFHFPPPKCWTIVSKTTPISLSSLSPPPPPPPKYFFPWKKH